jgi:ribokinase
MTVPPAARAAVYSGGTVNADLLLQIDGRLEPGASLVARQVLRTSGGRAANVAVMARRLGTPARLFGCVGCDALAELALAGPRAAGVEVDKVRHVKDDDTGVAAIVVGEGATKTMLLAAGANDAFGQADGERFAAAVRAAPDGSVVVVDTELAEHAILPALDAARARRATAVVDPTRPARTTAAVLRLAEHLTPNADEAERLTGIVVDTPPAARRAAEQLRGQGANYVHVRLPRGGCLSVGPDREMLFRAPDELPVVDTTGAGDAFAGTLASGLAARVGLVDAIRRAVAAAACAVTGFGAQESYPDPSTLGAMAQRVSATG